MQIEKIKDKEGNIIQEIFNSTNDSRIIAVKYFDNDGKLHRENGPAFIYFYKSGELLQEKYYFHGIRHRKDDYQSISYYPNGNIWKLEYYENDTLIDSKTFI
jgi:antitoxin component YwqK of YwqJK toxin-antitoxin module